MRLTTARYYTPSGRSIQAVGIEPDIVVEQARIEQISQPQQRREADLRGALNQEQSGPQPDGAPANGTEAPDADGASPAADTAVDYQLTRALDLVRGLALFANRPAPGPR
jgi:carboxyl-terminal processing protease